MKKQKCTKCNRFQDETGANFAKRTKNIFSLLPFFCKDCTRVHNALNPSDKILKEQQKTEKRRLIKKTQRQVVNDFSARNFVKEGIEENKIIARKKGRIQGNITRAKRAHAYIPVEHEEKLAIRKFYDECPSGYHVDHIIPISKGGKHILVNLQYLPAKENMAKNNRISREALEKYVEMGSLSVTYLQRKFKLTFEAAENLINELNIYQI